MTQTSTRPPNPAGTRLTGVFPMGLAAWIVTAVFMLSNSPTPLAVQWQDQLGFSSGMLTVIFAAYMVGLLVTLTVAGQLADRFGRKPVLIPGLVLAMVACGLFAFTSSVLLLVAARFLTGIAVGVIVSAGMAAVVDVGGPARHRQASLAASVAMVLGAGLGPYCQDCSLKRCPPIPLRLSLPSSSYSSRQRWPLRACCHFALRSHTRPPTGPGYRSDSNCHVSQGPTGTTLSTALLSSRRGSPLPRSCSPSALPSWRTCCMRPARS